MKKEVFMEKYENIGVMTIKQFSDKTGIRIWLIRRLVSEGKLVCVKTKKRFYIDYEESMKLLWIR